MRPTHPRASRNYAMAACPFEVKLKKKIKKMSMGKSLGSFPKDKYALEVFEFTFPSSPQEA